MIKLRLAFMGTPDFAVPILQAIVSAGHEIAAVYCQPPRPARRGHRPQRSAVQAFAEGLGLPLRMPERLDAAASADFGALALDVAVVAAYGLILPKSVLAAPRLGCINVHASLLPRWRGAAPIQRALLAGDVETGVTIMQMDEGLDTGAILLAAPISIGPDMTATELHDMLSALGAGLIVSVLDGLAAGRLIPRPQPAEGVTYARKLTRDEGRLDWRRPATALERGVRALNPWPGVWFEAAGERIKVLAAELADRTSRVSGILPGTVIDERLTVACGEGCLRLLVVQRAGRAPQEVGAFLRGYAITAGTVLPCPDIV